MFDYYVSLGASCPIAASMSKYGLRSFSAPFDWLITPSLKWVLYYLETDFNDFLLQENLERYDEHSKHFCDKKSGIKFIHDNENFETEYDRLKDKYNRRINRFINRSKSRICYLRSLRSKEELEYVIGNAAYIKYVIRKQNCHSEIVFLCSKDLEIPDEFEFQHYIMPGIWSGTSRRNLRAHFDHADDFLNFCGENYLGVNLIKNLAFDIQAEEHNMVLYERRYKTLSTLLSHDFSNDILSDKVIIYGAGVIGTELYKRIKYITSVIYFVDKEKAGSEYESIKIVSEDEIINEENAKIIVSATYDFENIKKKLLDKFKNEDIISLDDILNLKF